MPAAPEMANATSPASPWAPDVEPVAVDVDGKGRKTFLDPDRLRDSVQHVRENLASDN